MMTKEQIEAYNQGLQDAIDLCDKSTFEGGVAKSMAFFLNSSDYNFYKEACFNYMHAIEDLKK
jgi:hypothetical protein